MTRLDEAPCEGQRLLLGAVPPVGQRSRHGLWFGIGLLFKRVLALCGAAQQPRSLFCFKNALQKPAHQAERDRRTSRARRLESYGQTSAAPRTASSASVVRVRHNWQASTLPTADKRCPAPLRNAFINLHGHLCESAYGLSSAAGWYRPHTNRAPHYCKAHHYAWPAARF